MANKKSSKKAKAKLAKPVQKTTKKSFRWSRFFLKILFIAILIYGLFHATVISFYEGISIIVGAVVVALIVLVVSRLIKK